jgi:hypothetical protein
VLDAADGFRDLKQRFPRADAFAQQDAVVERRIRRPILDVVGLDTPGV